MKSINIALSILIAVISISCSSDSKPVAHYKYGVITRGEVTRRAQGIKLSPQLQNSIIESLCVESVALHDALAAGYDKNDTYLLRVERETWPVLKKLVNEKNRDALGLSWDFVKCRHIAFNGGGTENTRKKALDSAKKVIELLGKGAKFDSLAKSYSSDPQNAVAMSVVYAVKGAGRPEFEDAAFGLAEGAYSSEPVLLPNGTAMVILSDEKGNFTLENMEKKITSPNEYKRLSTLVENIAYVKLVTELEKNNNASFKTGAFTEKDNEVIFSVSGKDYSYKDLMKRRDIFSSIIREPLVSKSFLFGFAREWYFSEIYKAEALKKGYLNDKKLISELKSSSDFILANDYIRYVCEKEIIIPEKDMLDEYSKNKTHYMKKGESKTKKPLQLSYNDAKVFLRKNLLQSRVGAAMEAWRKKALAESGLVIKD